MKITIFTDTYTPEINGIVTSVDTFSKLLVEQGHKVMIVAPKYTGFKDTKRSGIAVVRYPSISFASYKDVKVAFPRVIDLFRRLKKFKPELIHIQTPSNLGLVGIAMAKALKIPNIQTYHTYLPELAVYFDIAKLFGLEKIPEAIDTSRFSQKIMATDFYDFLMRASKTESLSEFIGFKKDKPKPNYKVTINALWAFSRWVYNRADLVLTPSQVLADILKKHGIKTVVSVQTNGIWKEEFPVKEIYNNSGKLLHVGRLGFEKKVDVILSAFALASKENKSLTLDIIGDGPARGELEKQAKKLKIVGKVKFWGFVERKTLIRMLPDYELFLTASPMETQGLVILEAMAAGLPVVGVNKLAIPEIVRNGRNGYTVRLGDSKKMAEKIVRIMEDKVLRAKFGRQSVIYAKSHDMPIAVKLLEEHYKSVLGQRP